MSESTSDEYDESIVEEGEILDDDEEEEVEEEAKAEGVEKGIYYTKFEDIPKPKR